jgi:hypothetical protein
VANVGVIGVDGCLAAAAAAVLLCSVFVHPDQVVYWAGALDHMQLQTINQLINVTSVAILISR